MSPEIIVAIASGVIALAALGVALWQGIVTRQHNRLSVTPHLRIDIHRASAVGSVKVLLSNKGTGPAIITSSEIKVDDIALDGNPVTQMVEALEKIGVIDSPCHGHILLRGEAIAPGETLTLLDFPLSEKEEAARDHVESALERITFIVHYESIYGTKFLVEYSAFKRAALLQGYVQDDDKRVR